jgi:hypothetical protein
MFGKNPGHQQPFLADRGQLLAERIGGGATFELSTKGASNN